MKKGIPGNSSDDEPVLVASIGEDNIMATAAVVLRIEPDGEGVLTEIERRVGRGAAIAHV